MLSDFLPDSWQTGAWFANPELVKPLVGLVSNPLALVDNLRTGTTPVRMMNMPIFFTGALPALNVAGDILLVDPQYYVVGDRAGLQISFSEHYRFLNDQGAWRVTKRVDGQPLVQTEITLENASTVVSPFVALAAG